jgi:23S rRNA (uracil1939-C5)-methyltransferase
MREAEVRIDKVVAGGKGMGLVDGKVVFVDYVVPGDVALINITKEKKKYMAGEVVRLLKPSADRVEPECEYFGVCGGCSFFNVGYETELKYKKQLFLETVRRIGKVELDDVEIKRAPSSTHYRNRVQFKVRAVDGEVELGFYKKGTNHVVNIDRCMIASERINRCIQPVKELVKALPFRENIPQIDLTVDDEGKRVVMIMHLITDGYSFSNMKDVLRDLFPEYFGSYVVPFVQAGRKSTLTPVMKGSGDQGVSYTLKNSAGGPGYRIGLSPGAFLQVNYAQNVTLVDTMLSYLKLGGDDTVLDLFCGAGNFSFAASWFCGSVTGIESYDQAVDDAIKNMDAFDIKNVSFISGDVTKEVRRLKKEGARFDCLILDPPREGAITVLKELKELIKGKIVYISCDIATFSRDAAYLQDAGFRLTDISLIDMFPRTHHIEAISGWASMDAF